MARSVTITAAEPVCSMTIDGNPVPKGRPRFTRTGRTFTPKTTIDAEDRVAKLVKIKLMESDLRFPLADVRFRVDVAFHERRQVGQWVDADNAQKLIGDALNGVVWEDDTQIAEWHVTIERGAGRPRTELTIWALEAA